jgi:putative peptide zinc metalloprotease protein
LNFLNLPVSDDELLFKRHLQRSEARSKGHLMNFIFFKMPLLNPDSLLNRTQHLTRFLFTRWFFAFWVVLMAGAGLLVIRDLDKLFLPIEGILAANNLPLIMVLLIVLKVIHEFGHAYACKRFGGHVPEMGVYLIVFAPLAYVDATSSWGFPLKRHRLLVGLAGVYFESIVTALAVFTWFFTGPGLLHDIAYNVIFLAGVTTVIFNLNPLMRYDGYYVLSDLSEIPNLRQRATHYVIQSLKRIFLGLKTGTRPGTLGLRLFLFFYGTAASLYRITLVLAISAAIASKLLVVGLLIAGYYAGGTLVKVLFKVGQYLFMSPEAAPVRWRAVTLGLLLLIAIPWSILSIGLPNTVRVAGIFGTEEEKLVRASVDGFVEEIRATHGNIVASEEILVSLVNDTLGEALARASSDLAVSRLRLDAFQAVNPVRAKQEQKRSEVLRFEMDQCLRDVDELTVRSPREGRVIEILTLRDKGRFLTKGDPIATIASGRWEIRAVLNEAEFVDARPAVGDTLRVRTSAKPGALLEAIVRRIVPRGTRNALEESLTQKGGGSIPVDPETSAAAESYFEIVLELTDEKPSWLLHGMTCQVLCPGERDTLGTLIMRRISRFITRFMES